jgi:hypothetical protein
VKLRGLSVFLILSLVMLGALPSGTVKTAEAAQNSEWNTQKYGDVKDIGPKLRKQAEDEDFQKKVKEKIKEEASKTNFDESSSDNKTATDGNFTYDGGTKYFLNINYAFKEFTLRSVGENVEIWVANDLSFPEGDERPAPVITQDQVDKLAQEFDNNIYPKEIEFFGQPNTHTGDNSLLEQLGLVPEDYYVSEEGKNIVLVDNIVDENYADPAYPFFVAGFYQPYFETYIDRNIVTIDTNNWQERLESTFYGTLAHEYQHLIHDDNDSDETTWINEGMSDFAEYLVGYGHPMGHVNFFLDHPENSLVEWDEYYSAETGPETLADYGQAYLFQLYLNDHYGKEFIRTLAKEPKNGIEGINHVLQQYNAGTDFEELFRRFTVALQVDSPKPGKGEYNFDSIDLKVNDESAEATDKEGVPAWGADYIKLDDSDKVKNIEFDGIDFMPVKWQSVQDPLNEGNQVLWGNNGNQVDNELILEADLTGVETATMNFDNYIDIEEAWDYGFVQVSTDGGKTWTSLSNENTRSDVASGGYPDIKDNVPGFTGYYDSWVNETFDLSEYAGQKVLVSFRYMTDWAYNDSGWFIDNIEIPEIGYSNDGSSVDDFRSIDEITGQYVEYGVTFINEKGVGKNKSRTQYKVLNYDPANITERDSMKLKKILSKGDNYMIVWYPAAIGTKGAADYSYELIKKSNHNKR